MTQEEKNYLRELATKYPPSPYERRRERARIKRQEEKREALEHYCSGGIMCSRCGFNEHPCALTVSPSDHPNMYNWLKSNFFPKGHRVLCANCQLIERIERGESKDARELSAYLEYLEKA